MNNFFDRFKPKEDDGKKKKKDNNNPMAGWFPGSNNRTFGGQGQSLGGSHAGKVIDIILSNPGPLGVRVEKRPASDTAIVSQVVVGSQAEMAGLQRGDILCFADSNGQDEINYKMFLELAKSNQRPLCFQVRRVPSTKAAAAAATAASSDTATQSTKKKSSSSSADAYARKQAVIAAAEKREKAHKQKVKPIPKTNKDNLPKILTSVEREKLEQERKQRIEDDKNKTVSVATKQALEKAKQSEKQTAAELGYNPYEVKNMTSGQARNAVTTSTHGSIQDDDNPNATQQQQQPQIPSVAAPQSVPTAAEQEEPPPSQSFQDAFETVVTSQPDQSLAVNSVTIMRKLIVNATTKGQVTEDANAAAKFRKIRLSNTKIAAAVTNVPGAVDLLLEVGFQLHTDEENDDESILVYPPPPCPSKPWLPAALEQMEKYVQQS